MTRASRSPKHASKFSDPVDKIPKSSYIKRKLILTMQQLKRDAMRIFTPEAAEQVISLLCYTRTEDTYTSSHAGRNRTNAGAFRLAVTVNRHANRLALSDRYDSLFCRTITVESALQKSLLKPSWEDLAIRLYLNDQDILYMCLMSREEPVCLRLIEAERIIAYRDRHNEKAMTKKFTYLPGQPKRDLRLTTAKSAADRQRTGEKGRYVRKHHAA